MEVFVDGMSDGGADLIDGRELLLGGVLQGTEGAELAGQDISDAGADVGDFQAGKETIKAAGFGALDGIDDVLSAFIAHAFQLQKLVLGQTIEIGEGLDQTIVNELLDELLADLLNVHLVAAAEPLEALLEGTRAVAVG